MEQGALESLAFPLIQRQQNWLQWDKRDSPTPPPAPRLQTLADFSAACVNNAATGRAQKQLDRSLALHSISTKPSSAHTSL